MDDLLDTLIAELWERGRRLRELNLRVSSLGSCMGHGLEQVVKEIVEEFAGQAFPVAYNHTDHRKGQTDVSPPAKRGFTSIKLVHWTHWN